ncbi:hypothetical protein H0H93_007825 [Arthromyces matolae]|nr:hypothetical protein H0H93_007825 [Arthromyces matolae]
MEAAVLPAAPAKKEEEQTKKPEEKKGKVESVVERGIRQMKERLCEVVVNYAPPVVQEFGRRLDDWWNKERLEKIAQSNLPNMELDAVIVEVLSTLVSASLTEDKYGVVQRDIPKILEAMLSFHSAIQSYRAEVQAKYTPPVQDQVYTPEEIDESEALRLEVERASEVLNYLSESGSVRRFFFKLDLLGKKLRRDGDRVSEDEDEDEDEDTTRMVVDLDPVVDTPASKKENEKPEYRSLSSHSASASASASIPAGPIGNGNGIRDRFLPRNPQTSAAAVVPTHKDPNPNPNPNPNQNQQSQVAIINEDPSSDAIIITTLSTIPFCCHEDLLTMSLDQLVRVARALNERLPRALAIDVDIDTVWGRGRGRGRGRVDRRWILREIERVVGIRGSDGDGDGASRGKASDERLKLLDLSRSKTESRGVIGVEAGGITRGFSEGRRTPPPPATSSLANRTNLSFKRTGSMLSPPPLHRLVEEDEEKDWEEEEEEREEKVKEKVPVNSMSTDIRSKRRKIICEDTGGDSSDSDSDSDSDIREDPQQTTPTPPPRIQRTQSQVSYYRRDPTATTAPTAIAPRPASPTPPRRVLRSQSANVYIGRARAPMPAATTSTAMAKSMTIDTSFMYDNNNRPRPRSQRGRYQCRTNLNMERTGTGPETTTTTRSERGSLPIGASGSGRSGRGGGRLRPSAQARNRGPIYVEHSLNSGSGSGSGAGSGSGSGQQRARVGWNDCPEPACLVAEGLDRMRMGGDMDVDA